MIRNMVCEQQVHTGPRRGLWCKNKATCIVVSTGLLTCGIHKRAFTRRGLARIAYYNPKTDAWF